MKQGQPLLLSNEDRVIAVEQPKIEALAKHAQDNKPTVAPAAPAPEVNPLVQEVVPAPAEAIPAAPAAFATEPSVVAPVTPEVNPLVQEVTPAPAETIPTAPAAFVTEPSSSAPAAPVMETGLEGLQMMPETPVVPTNGEVLAQQFTPETVAVPEQVVVAPASPAPEIAPFTQEVQPLEVVPAPAEVIPAAPAAFAAEPAVAEPEVNNVEKMNNDKALVLIEELELKNAEIAQKITSIKALLAQKSVEPIVNTVANNTPTEVIPFPTAPAPQAEIKSFAPQGAGTTNMFDEPATGMGMASGF